MASVSAEPKTLDEPTATGARWILPVSMTQQVETGHEYPDWFSSLLRQRGVLDAAAAESFLRPSLRHLHDPFHMRDMSRAVERIVAAVRAQEPILIYGDYDVDGTVATVLLKSAIDRVTPKDVGSLVRFHIPHRMREGYGMQAEVLDAAALTGVRLVISVDTGIRAFVAASEARRLGLDLIVTDHHLPDGAGLPDAYAVVHPNQPGCPYPFKDLCGAGVACKLAEALLRYVARVKNMEGLRAVSMESVETKLLPSFLKLLAIATVADAVPLHGENRTLVALGTQGLRETRQHGLRALMDLSRVSLEGGQFAPTATEIAFRIAPRINAAGRMDVASDVIQLLLTSDIEEGRALAGKLHRLNDDRRAAEAAVLQAVVEHLRIAEFGAGRCLVLDGEGWHRGVVGIAASRVVEMTGLPALVISHEHGQAHGSGRSIAGFHLLDALTAVQSASSGSLLDRFGGHAHAVGFSLRSEKIVELRERLHAYAAERISDAMLEKTLSIDAELPLAQVNLDTLRLLQQLEPYGQANREPLFLARSVVVWEDPRVLKELHVKLKLSSGEGGTPVACLGWSRGTAWPARLQELGVEAGTHVDVLFRLRENRHPEFGGPELELCDLRRSVPAFHGERNFLERRPEPCVL